MTTDAFFPPPRIFAKLYSLVKQDFPKYLQIGYSETPQNTGTGLEKEVVKLLEQSSVGYNYRIHLRDQASVRGFAGLLHKFDAGIEDRDDLSQCLFEVKYRSVDGILKQEDIMKFHHATFEYFLKFLTEQRWGKLDIFRCFVTNLEVNDEFRQFFYTWGIALIDPALRPLPLIKIILERFEEEYGPTDQLLEFIEQSNNLTIQAYFSLVDLIPPDQKSVNVLELDKLNPAVNSMKILAEHKYLNNEIDILQRQYRRGRYR